MTRLSCAAVLAAATIVGVPGSRSASAQEAPALAGRWTLDRAASQSPREVGFGADWLPAGGSDTGAEPGGGGGRRGSGAPAAGAFLARRESEDDAARVQQLTAEVRNPATHLTIVDTPSAITITDDRGRSRTFHPDGRQELLQLDSVPVGATATREGGRLVVVYQVEEGRELRYTYSRSIAPPQLVVDVQFLEKGKGDTVRRVYVPSSADETQPPSPAAPAPAIDRQGVPAGGALAPASLPAIDERPDADLKGLAALGVVVEGLSSQAAACGLNQGTLETAVSKHLSDAGFTVRRNSDEDTYVYVNVITSSLSSGLCVSRYDVFLYTQTTAKLSYHDAPVLVQVSLLHKGGLAGGASAAHAEGVTRGVLDFVDEFATRIRAANR